MLLGFLLLHRNNPAAVDRLIDTLWGERPPPTAPTALQGHIARLRKLLGKERLVTQNGGYLLRVGTGELDADRFELLLDEGRFAEGLRLWRGPVLLDCADEPFAQSEIGRLEDLRLVALERMLETDIDAGRAAEAASQLEPLVAEHPFRERLRYLLMLALYRGGRQAEALSAYQEARGMLVEELGIEPSNELAGLQQRILTHDPALAASQTTPADSPLVPAHEGRKTVTVVCCDLAGSAEMGEQLDTEAYQTFLERFADASGAAFERHGGSVADGSGETVFGTFGLNQAHEDDAMRALRAAAELPDGLAALGVRPKVGVATGELVTVGRGGPPVGAVVGQAARLREGARPGTVLLDEHTLTRCRDAVAVEAVELRVEGKRPTNAYKLEAIVAGAPTFRRRFETPLVGRSGELADLRHVFDRVVERRAPAVLTLLGAPGIGKTRLAREFASSLRHEARVLVGHCPPYGEGVIYAPLREIVFEAFGAEPTAELVERALKGGPDTKAAVHQLEIALGLSEEQTSKEETFWAVRRLVEELARERPLILVVEDVHWAEDAFVELLEYLVDFVRNVPLLLFCIARPEFAEDRPQWPGRNGYSSTLLLQPLSRRESRALVDHLAHEADPALRTRVAGAAEGNPLYAEQMLAHALEHGGCVEAPPTIQALLAARVDHLSSGERAVAEAASVVGIDFWRNAVEELVPTGARSVLQRYIAGLVRRDLVRPVTSAQRPDAFRFGHALVRNAVYSTISKRRRADLHESFAVWLAASREEDEVVGYHLEQAHRALRDLGRTGEERTRTLGSRAAVRLESAGMRAVRRGDFVGAQSLLSRALALEPDDDPHRPELLIAFGKALTGLTLEPEAHDTFAEAESLAHRASDSRTELRARLLRWSREVHLHPELDARRVEQDARAAAEAFEEARDDLAAYEAWIVVHNLLYCRTQYAGALMAVERAIPHGRTSGMLEARIESREMLLRLYGPSPSSQGLERAEALLATDLGAASRADVLAYGGVLLAMRGDFERGRECVARATELWDEVGTHVSGWRGEESWVELLSGDLAAAERSLRAQCALLDEPGRGHAFATYGATLAHVLHALGRDAEALEWSDRCAKRSPEFDVATQADWRAAKAKVLARAGSHAEAEELARRAVEYAEQTDALWQQGKTHLDLAEVLELGRRKKEAADAARASLRCYERKEHFVGAAEASRALERLDAVKPTT
jgi:DNA-binding SARP family transcriptional activator